MENLSPAGETLTFPVTIPVTAQLSDHRVAGRVVLPAVEALQLLARTLPAEAGADPLHQEGAAFAHLLTVDLQAAVLEALHEFSRLADGRCLSRLTTSRSGAQARWTRRVEHAAVVFGPGAAEARDGGPLPREGEKGPEKALVGDDAAVAAEKGEAPAGEGWSGAAVFRFSPQRLYADLVPFGPAYRNVTGEVTLTTAGAAAEVTGGPPGAAGPLGSPFPLDAAFHLACAWGQRYGNRIVFPVGFARRTILRPTEAGVCYRCTAVPLPGEGGSLRFDLTIAAAGRPVEIVRGLQMREITAGGRRPPAWVREGL